MSEQRIARFQGAHRFLSNFWIEPDGKSNEHWFQAGKFLSSDESDYIISAPKPGQAKRRAYKLGKNRVRPDWDDVFRVPFMYRLLQRKFAIPELREKLLATGDAELIEGNHWHDNFWGDCSCDDCKDIPGENMLGKLLMEVRSEIREEIDLLRGPR